MIPGETQKLVNVKALSLFGELYGVGGDVAAQDSSALLPPRPAVQPGCHLAVLWSHCLGTGRQRGGERVFTFFSKPSLGAGRFSPRSRACCMKGIGTGGLEDTISATHKLTNSNL